jgi:hypothetical protein
MKTIEQLEKEIAERRAEIERLKQANSRYPAYGTKGFTLYGNGRTEEQIFEGWGTLRGYCDQGNWFPSHKEAEMVANYRAAITTVNRAILAGEDGRFVPYYSHWEGEWMCGNGTDGVLARGSLDNIKSVIKSHPAEFAAIREYQRVVLERGE